jgi:two-component system sensor histidine kinase UhpB
VAIACFCVDRLVYLLGIPPNYVGTFWPGTPLLMAVLFLTPRRLWLLLIIAGLGAFTVADLPNSTPVGAAWITLGNVVELLIGILGIQLLFHGAPYLANVGDLAKFFLVASVLAPSVSGLVGANCAPPGGYWVQWRLWCFADALGFLTITPAILSWARDGRSWLRNPRNYLELAGLLSLLAFSGYLAFVRGWGTDSPALLYSLLPLLLWAALRLGVKGTSSSMIMIAYMAIAGAAHDRGPFAGQGPLNNALSLQLFLFFAAVPFMVLAVVVEKEKQDEAKRTAAEYALRQSEEQLRLAQEEERTRIARDLHDDVNQRLAMLSIGLDQVRNDSPELRPELREQLDELLRQTNQISSDVQSISHELHPSKLDYLGIVGAIKSFCQEFGERQRVEIQFLHEDVPIAVPREVSICLFRVLQEALRNAVKHSGERRFEVCLYGETRGIGLRVSDSGMGFDMESENRPRGLGLISMRERLRLVHGTLSIGTKPSSGTTIDAFVPLSGQDNLTAAGPG